MRVVFAGTPEVAIPSLDALVASSHEVVAVVTRADAPAGRGRRLEPSPVRRRADELGLPVLTPPAAKDPDFLAELARIAPDLCTVVAYGHLITQAGLDIPVHGWVNLHFSLLPAWRGAAPVQHAIMAGDEMTGATTFRLERGMDTGPVYGVMTEPIRPDDTAGDLLGRLATGGAGLLVATVDGIESGTLVPKPQPAEGVSLAPKIDVDDARIRWDGPALAVDRQVRGCTPAPGAWTTFRGERLRLGPVTLPDPGEQAVDRLAPGSVVATKRAVLVGTASDAVRLGTVQAQGKRPMPAADWARGARVEPGERFDHE
ncbi:MAG TPA: methionyl-tRNA formyltransferase [Intrasporangium sp.]|nr:methionyl-tRNA formyltransferase [Intrasporangium sp.]